MKRIFFLTSLLVLMFVMSANHNYLNAQEKEKPKIDPNRGITKVVFQDEINVDELKTSTIIDQKVNEIDGKQVVVTRFEPNKEFGKTIYFYYSPEDQSLEVSSIRCAVRSILSYSINNKTYAYRVLYVELVGIKERGRTDFEVYYFDYDGDGKFETMYFQRNFVQKIPEWVLKNNK